ncbi:MAG: COQ9 family protein [Rhodospirillales bacterium]|nr:COQ9 family protein [Rhodospirillales bacterium]
MTVLPPDLDDARRELLASVLKHVPFEGWSDAALQMAAEDLTVDIGEARLLFPNGPADMVDFYLTDGDRRMAAALADRDLSNLRVRDRVALAVRSRIEPELATPEVLRRTATWLSLPQNGIFALRAGYRTVDAMWAVVGDSSVDFNFYTKRALLLGVHSGTVLYALGDKSPDHEDTWAFLDRRIDDVMKIQKARGRLDDFLGQIGRSVGRR